MPRLLVLSSILLLAVGCASGGGSAQPELVSREDRYYLVSPLEGYPLSVGPDVRIQLEKAHRALIEKGDQKAVDQAAVKLQERNPDLAPTSVLQAQADFVSGLYQEVLDRLGPVVAQHPDYVAAQLLFGRSSEQVGDLVQSLEAYERISTASPLAHSRALDLAPRVTDEMGRRIEDALAKGHTAEARSDLERLQTWSPDADGTLAMTARVAQVTGDEVAEIEALRRLSSRQPDNQEISKRRAELELKIGDPAAGMRLIEELAARNPEDLEIQEELAEARFLWRLQLLPPEVRRIADQTELTRGDFAVMIYWLFPEIRYGRSGDARIANDILDHPQREPLVRVINSGIMEVDSSLHRFEPYRRLQRHEALAAMVGLLARKQPPFACLGSSRTPSSRQGVCSASVACGLVESAADCLPTAPVSGAEAVEVCRSAQELMGVK